MTETKELRRGATFSTDITIRAKDGSDLPSLDGAAIRSQVRRYDGELVDDLTVTIIDAGARVFRIENTLPTGTWPLAKLNCDIKVVWADGRVDITSLVRIDVQEPVTR